jgi:hypothetical protein
MGSFKKVTLKKFIGEGLALLDSSNGQANLHDVLQAIAKGRDYMVRRGCLTQAPTTPSAQITGAGNTSWRQNIDAGVVRVAGVDKDFAAQADFVIHSGSQLIAQGQSAVAAIVAKKAADGTISMIAVKGAAATTGAQLSPTDTAIQTAVGAGLDWVKVSEVQIDRTADTTLVSTIFNSRADVGDGLIVE